MSFLTSLPIKLRLTILVLIAIAMTMIIGIFAINGMRSANLSIEDMYSGGMHHTHALGVVLEHSSDNRTQLLLSLQHDPSTEYASMHDHGTSQHLDIISHNIEQIDEHWKEITDSELDSEERSVANEFELHKKKLESEGIFPAVREIKAGNYTEANRIILEVINPTFKKSHLAAEKLFDMQMEEAEASFTQSYENYQAMLKLVILIVVIGSIFCGVLAYLSISSIAKGVESIEKSAKSMADGDLTVRVDYQAKDELGHIASEFNSMSEKFSNTISQVKDSIIQLASAAEQTSAVTAQTTSAINQQKSETEQIATAINQMNTTVHDVAQNAVHAAEATEKADQSSAKGKDVVTHTIEAIGQLASEVDQAAKVIHRLESETESIGSVLDVIKSIAEQTNLLALNAAIEAARAGEQGRGFAVVADEVRTLAGRTQKSTQEIEEMISKLQTGAVQAVQVMETSKEKSVIGVEQAGLAGESLKTINDAVDQINSMNTQIASAAEEQGTVTEEINRNIVNISEVAEQTAIGAEQTAQASKDLAELSEQLKSLIAQFKV
jgi:methyl-accepting chemotaxis protein